MVLNQQAWHHLSCWWPNRIDALIFFFWSQKPGVTTWLCTCMCVCQWHMGHLLISIQAAVIVLNLRALKCSSVKMNFQTTKCILVSSSLLHLGYLIWKALPWVSLMATCSWAWLHDYLPSNSMDDIIKWYNYSLIAY